MPQARKGFSAYTKKGYDGEFCGHIHKSYDNSAIRRCEERLEKSYSGQKVIVAESYTTNYPIGNQTVTINCWTTGGTKNYLFDPVNRLYRYSVITKPSGGNTF